MASAPECADVNSPSFRLDGRLIVVTGASEGIGRDFALAFSRQGAEVVLVSRRPDKLLEVQRLIEANGGQASVIPADVSRLDDLRSLAAGVSKLVEGRDVSMVLVNNAGFAFTKDALDVSEEDWNHVLDVHVKGSFFCSQLLGRQMLRKGYGKIINLSSTWSASTDAGKSVYCIAKAAVSQLTAALSTEWAQAGVRVNAIAPSTTLSENTISNLKRDPARARRLKERITLGRFAEPSDLVGAAIFLASPASDFITGHTLFVDGGWHAAR